MMDIKCFPRCVVTYKKVKNTLLLMEVFLLKIYINVDLWRCDKNIYRIKIDTVE